MRLYLGRCSSRRRALLRGWRAVVGLVVAAGAVGGGACASSEGQGLGEGVAVVGGESGGSGSEAGSHTASRGKDVGGGVVVWLGPNGPKDLDRGVFSRVLSARDRYATEQLGGAESIGPAVEGTGRAGGSSRSDGSSGSGDAGARGPQAGCGRRGAAAAAELTTVPRLGT